MPRTSGALVLVTAWALAGGAAAAQGPVAPPPNKAADVQWDAGSGALRLTYQGQVLLEAAVAAQDGGGKAIPAAVALQPAVTTGKASHAGPEKPAPDDEKVEQRLRFTLADPKDGASLVLRGTVTGSEEAFPAETAGGPQKRFPLVRASVGPGRSLRNNAIYDRRWDWMLAGPDDGATRIQPKAAGRQGIPFAWESRGPSIELVFRPRFYQKHRGLARFEPWTYRVWKGSVTGYCTWWAYKGDFSQQKLDAIVDVFAAKKLADFGYTYVQLDDAYQIGNGSCPKNWLTWNGRFPGGADYAIRRIRSAGMKPGIWVHRVHRPGDPNVADIGSQHPDWFVQKPDGTLFKDGGFFVLNTKNGDALEGMVRALYRELKKQQWDYVKIDGAGDLLGAYNNKNCAEHFRKINSTPVESLRDWDRVAREELGTGIYILNCWGVGPGLGVVGLVDGCRLGSDGFQPETLAQFSSYEGVVWRNDPDHCDILGSWLMDENAAMPVFGRPAPVPVRTVVRPAICSLAGGVLMVSDKAEVYQDDGNLEGMKRSAPVLPTVPGQLYDPGHRSAAWWLQEIARPFENWTVLSRIQWAKKREKEWKFDLQGLPAQEVAFADLGLDPAAEYLVFEFWRQTFLGKFKTSFTAPAMDTRDGMDVFAIREARPHPWVLSTTRHLSQGGVDLLDERWDAAGMTLSGRSAGVAGDPYVLTVHLPQGFRLRNAEVKGEKVEIANRQETATVRVMPAATGTLEWSMAFDVHRAGGVGPDAAAPGWPVGPFVKRPQPILSPSPESRFRCPVLGKEVRWEEQNVYNPAAVVRDGKVYLFYRADDQNPALKWGRTCRIGMAQSEDGISFTRHPVPVLYPDNDEWKEYEWEGGCEDLHVVEGEDGVYYMNYTTWSGRRDTMSVATSRDLVRWTKHGPAFRKAAPEKVPGSRSGVVVSRRQGDRLVAAKIDGKYWMYYTHPCGIAWSENLIDWTPTGRAVWPGGGREAGAIALLREDGILLMTQGGHPSLGAWVLRQALIDRNDLKTVLKEQGEPFLYPEADWEKKGFCGNTTVANGLVPFKGRWMLYYGGADRVIGLATCERAE